MIKVQTLRLRGLCASSLLALAACSGTPSDSDLSGSGFHSADGTPLTESSAGSNVQLDDVTNGVSSPQGQDPQGRAALIQKALESFDEAERLSRLGEFGMPGSQEDRAGLRSGSPSL